MPRPTAYVVCDGFTVLTTFADHDDASEFVADLIARGRVPDRIEIYLIPR